MGFDQAKGRSLNSIWATCKLSECLSTLESGLRPKGGTLGVANGVPSIGGEHITKDGELDLTQIRYVPTDFFNSMARGRVHANDVLLVKDGATIGKATLIRRPPYDRMAINEHVFLLRGNHLLTQEFLYYTLASESTQWAIKHIQTGSAQPGLNAQFVEHILIQVPPLSEQQKIASILSCVDDNIQKTQQVIEKTEELKKGLMQQLLTRGIGHTRFKQTEIGEIPEEWEVVRLGDIAAVERGKFAFRPRNDPSFYGGTYPFIQTGDISSTSYVIRHYSQTLNEEGLAISKLFKKGTIVISIAANIGDVAMLGFDSCFPDSVVGITAGPRVNNLYLLYALRRFKTILNMRAPQSTQKNINLDTLRPLKLSLPTGQEQEQIATMLSQLDERVELERQMLFRLEALKKGLMQVLLTGKARVKVDSRSEATP